MKFNFTGNGDGFEIRITVKWLRAIPFVVGLGIAAHYANQNLSQILDLFGL
jgi:hypothetical protein